MPININLEILPPNSNYQKKNLDIGDGKGKLTILTSKGWTLLLYTMEMELSPKNVISFLNKDKYKSPVKLL